MTKGFLAYLITMAVVTYLVRAVPFCLFRRKVKSRFFRSFLSYIPYAVLAAMTFPAVFYVTKNPIPAVGGALTALFLAYRGKGLVTVSLSACSVALAANLLLFYFGG
ncbi:MAG: AzlD domain-containing protein [Lachnospiraceae bacterium]|nr:AzlD domain-containing protein [Lachnospiraceae bacterium]